MMKKIFLLIPAFAISCITSCAAPKIVETIKVTGKDKIEIGETTQFIGEITPAPKEEEKISWSSSNPDIAYVDSNGSVTGVSSGTTKIIASYGGKLESKDVYIGGYVTQPIEKIESINIDGEDGLKVGEYRKLTPVIYPENATNKDVTWESSNPKAVSVSKYGIIKAEHYKPEDSSFNEVLITAVSKENKEKVKSIKIHVTGKPNESNIKSFSLPSNVINYNEKINKLEDRIDETKINRNNSKDFINNNFFKYDDFEKDKQIYKVGFQNEFRFKCNITIGSKEDVFKETTENNPYQKYQLLNDKNEDVTSSGYMVNTYKGNEFQFNKTAENKVFTLRTWPDKNYYINSHDNYEDAKTHNLGAELTFKVVDGYNAYDFAGLTTVDNWSEARAREACAADKEDMEIINKGEFIDLWGDYKKKHNIPVKSYASTILHDDITVDTEDLPDNIKWTKKETEDYVKGNKFSKSKDRFDEFVTIKESVHSDDWGNLPKNVIKAKCINLLNGSLKDCCHIFNNVNYNSNDVKTFSLEGNYFTIDCSKVKPVCLFNVRILPEYQYVKAYKGTLIGRGFGNCEETHKKITSEGEDVYDTYRPYYYSRYKYPENPIYINNVNSFSNSTKEGTHDESQGTLVFCNTNDIELNNCILHKFSTCVNGDDNFKYVINKCKLFDTFAQIMYGYGSFIKIKDSILKDGDGGCIRSKSKMSLEINNSYLESFITGNEPFNKTYVKTIFTQLLGDIGNQCFTKFKDVKFGKDGCYGQTKNYIKVEDDVIYKNVIVSHELSSSEKPEEMQNTLFKSNGNTVFNLVDDYSSDGKIRQYIDSSLVLSCCMEGVGEQKDKGHARFPVQDIAVADNIQTYFNDGYESSYLSEYVENKEMYDKEKPEVAKNFGNLFSGDYLTFMFDIASKLHFTYVLGYK